MRDFENLRIAVAGTGYVGLSLAVLLAQHHQVTAVDIVPEKVDLINGGVARRVLRGQLTISIFENTVDALYADCQAEMTWQKSKYGNTVYFRLLFYHKGKELSEMGKES